MCLCCRGRGRVAEVGAQLVHCICRQAMFMLDWRSRMTSPFPRVSPVQARTHTNTHKLSTVLDRTRADDVTFTLSKMTSFCLLIFMCNRTCKYCMRLMVLLWVTSAFWSIVILFKLLQLFSLWADSHENLIKWIKFLLTTRSSSMSQCVHQFYYRHHVNINTYLTRISCPQNRTRLQETGCDQHTKGCEDSKEYVEMRRIILMFGVWIISLLLWIYFLYYRISGHICAI